jgi:hypothetical protein
VYGEQGATAPCILEYYMEVGSLLHFLATSHPGKELKVLAVYKAGMPLGVIWTVRIFVPTRSEH